MPCIFWKLLKKRCRAERDSAGASAARSRGHSTRPKSHDRRLVDTERRTNACGLSDLRRPVNPIDKLNLAVATFITSFLQAPPSRWLSSPHRRGLCWPASDAPFGCAKSNHNFAASATPLAKSIPAGICVRRERRCRHCDSTEPSANVLRSPHVATTPGSYGAIVLY